MNANRSMRAVLHELVRRNSLRQALQSGFETVSGDRGLCVRRRDVVEYVARVVGIKVINNGVFTDIEREAAELGWELIKNGGRSLFRCVKRKNQNRDEALLMSRANRHDPRLGQQSHREG